MENLRTYSNTKSVIAYVAENNLDARSLGVIVNKPNGDYGNSAWFVLTLRKKASEELEAAVGKEKAQQYAERQEVRVVGQSILPKLQTLLTGEEGEALYAKLKEYQEDKPFSEADAQAVLVAFIQLIKEDKLAISTVSFYNEGNTEVVLSKPVAHLRGSGASAETTALSW